MNGDRRWVDRVIREILQGIDNLPRKAEVVICPPFPYLEQVRQLLQNSQLGWGAQDLSPEQDGAFTGDVSATMLKDFSCSHVIVGHSERRFRHGESDDLVNAKAVAAKRVGIIPVICVGETRQQRTDGETEAVITRQLQALTSASADMVIAYEPVWAIGTGDTATPEQAQQVHALIRQQLRRQGVAADAVRILYGGSVTPGNASILFAGSEVDGGLIGGASLRARDFLQICGAAC